MEPLGPLAITGIAVFFLLLGSVIGLSFAKLVSKLMSSPKHRLRTTQKNNYLQICNALERCARANPAYLTNPAASVVLHRLYDFKKDGDLYALVVWKNQFHEQGMVGIWVTSDLRLVSDDTGLGGPTINMHASEENIIRFLELVGDWIKNFNTREERLRSR
jgi:hypothetical protein